MAWEPIEPAEYLKPLGENIRGVSPLFSMPADLVKAERVNFANAAATEAEFRAAAGLPLRASLKSV